MSYITCPCGFRADTADDQFDDMTDCLASFRAHGCQHHAAEVRKERSDWAGTVAFIALLVAVVAICAILGWTR